MPGPADGPRKVVISHPFDANGKPAKVWEVLDLDASGKLSKTGVLLEMGVTYQGEVVFTPDGQVGIAVQDDGTLGVLRFDGGGAEVVHAAFKGSFYAGAVVVDPSGDGAFVVDPNFRENGGGLYRVSIGCDGTLTDLGMVAPSKLAAGMVRLGATPAHAVLAARDVLTSKAGDNAHLLDLDGAAPALLGGAAAFPDDKAIVSAVARTHDDAFVLLGDNSEFSGMPTRVAVVSVSPSGLAPVQVLPLEDPMAIVTSPWNNAALVASGYEDAVFELGYDPGSATPFTAHGEIGYIEKQPELPGKAVMIERGMLKGRVLLAENMAVRMLEFEATGTVMDLGKLEMDDGLENIVGAIGVTP